jgi:hypothetical protein
MINKIKQIYIKIFNKFHILNLFLNTQKVFFYKKDLKKYKNKYFWKECFIFWAAPSIKDMNLLWLNNKYTFTVNKWHNLKQYWLNKSKFHVITDLNCYNELSKKNLDFSETYFLSSHILPKQKNFNFIRTENKVLFSKDISRHIFDYKSVISSTIQIAYYMGFKKIYLIWIDLSFSEEKSHFYEESKWERNRNKTESIKSKNKILKWVLMSNEILKKEKVELINLSLIKNSLPWIKKNKLSNI